MVSSIKARLVAFSVVVYLFSVAPATKADEYYMVLFAYQGAPNAPTQAHSFAVFFKVQNGPANDGDGVALEVRPLSWVNASGVTPRLLGPTEPGRILGLEATLQMAARSNYQITAWGPYRIDKELYDRAMAQIDRLNSGAVAYKMIDRRFRPGAAVNCIHAISDIAPGPLLDTGTAFGVPATGLIRNHFSRWILDEGAAHRKFAPSLGLDKYPIRYVD